jgi:hypothetical protein
MKMGSSCGAANFGGSRPFVAARLGSTQNQWFASYFRRSVHGPMAHARAMKILVPLCSANSSLGCIFDGAFCGARLQACRGDSRVDVFSAVTAIRIELNTKSMRYPLF